MPDQATALEAVKAAAEAHAQLAAHAQTEADKIEQQRATAMASLTAQQTAS